MATLEIPWWRDRGGENELVMEKMFAMWTWKVAVSVHLLMSLLLLLTLLVMTMERTAVSWKKGVCEVMLSWQK